MAMSVRQDTVFEDESNAPAATASASAFDEAQYAQNIVNFVQNNNVVVIPVLFDKRQPKISPDNASANPANIITWFREENVIPAAPCGLTNDILVVDCDVKHGVDGIKKFFDLCKIHQTEPSPVYQDTPSGGRHYFYRYDGVSGDMVGFWEKNSGIDIRGEGGIIFLDPNARRYVMHGNWEDRTPCPAWITAVAHRKYTSSDNVSHDIMEIVRAGVENIKKGAKGDRNRTLNVTCYWIGRVLGEAALQDVVEKALRDAALSIGLDSGEAARTARSGLRSGAGAGAPGSEERLPQFLCATETKSDVKEDESLAVDDFVGKLPPMPLEVFPEKTREAIAAITASKGVSQDMVGAFFLSLCAACIGRARTARYSRTWQEPGNLYFLVAAETGQGKSHTMKFVFDELSRMEEIVKMQYREDRRKYEEDMIVFRKRGSKEGGKGKGDAPSCSANTGKKDEMPKRPPNIQYILTDATMESAMDLLFDNPRGLCWLVDEFHNFIPGLDRYSAKGTSEAKRRLLSTWDGTKICVNRKAKDGVSNELYIESATFSICGCIQPHLLPEVFTYDDLHQGLPERFLFVNCPPQLPVPMPTPEIPEWVEKYLTRITRVMLGFAMEEDQYGRLRGLAIDLDDAARKEFNAFSNAMMKKTYGLTIHGFAAKMRGITLRLALLLHCLRHADDGDVTDGEITFGDMTNAIALSDYFFAQAQKMNTYIPDKRGNSRSATNDTHASRIAALLLEHIHEIGQLEGKVENKVFQGWFKKARLKINQIQLRDAFATLNIEMGREKSRRYRLVTTDVLDLCSKMQSRIRGVFESDEFDDRIDDEIKDG